MFVVISPHLDDAVLSLAQTMIATTDDVQVWTVFAGIPADPDYLSQYDKEHGFVTSAESVRARRLEDAAACDLIGATPKHLGYLDRQYSDREVAAREIANDLRGAWSEPFPEVFAPVGAGHRDHTLVNEAALLACPRNGTVHLYEDLPYRVHHPEQVVTQLRAARELGFEMQPVPEPLERGDAAVKAKAVACYRSQFPRGANDPAIMVPERVWRCYKFDRG